MDKQLRENWEKFFYMMGAAHDMYDVSTVTLGISDERVIRIHNTLFIIRYRGYLSRTLETDIWHLLQTSSEIETIVLLPETVGIGPYRSYLFDGPIKRAVNTSFMDSKKFDDHIMDETYMQLDTVGDLTLFHNYKVLGQLNDRYEVNPDFYHYALSPIQAAIDEELHR